MKELKYLIGVSLAFGLSFHFPFASLAQKIEIPNCSPKIEPVLPENLKKLEKDFKEYLKKSSELEGIHPSLESAASQFPFLPDSYFSPVLNLAKEYAKELEKIKKLIKEGKNKEAKELLKKFLVKKSSSQEINDLTKLIPQSLLKEKIWVDLKETSLENYFNGIANKINSLDEAAKNKTYEDIPELNRNFKALLTDFFNPLAKMVREVSDYEKEDIIQLSNFNPREKEKILNNIKEIEKEFDSLSNQNSKASYKKIEDLAIKVQVFQKDLEQKFNEFKFSQFSPAQKTTLSISEAYKELTTQKLKENLEDKAYQLIKENLRKSYLSSKDFSNKLKKEYPQNPALVYKYFLKHYYLQDDERLQFFPKEPSIKLTYNADEIEKRYKKTKEDKDDFRKIKLDLKRSFAAFNDPTDNFLKETLNKLESSDTSLASKEASEKLSECQQYLTSSTEILAKLKPLKYYSFYKIRPTDENRETFYKEILNLNKKNIVQGNYEKTNDYIRFFNSTTDFERIHLVTISKEQFEKQITLYNQSALLQLDKYKDYQIPSSISIPNIAKKGAKWVVGALDTITDTLQKKTSTDTGWEKVKFDYFVAYNPEEKGVPKPLGLLNDDITQAFVDPQFSLYISEEKKKLILQQYRPIFKKVVEKERNEHLEILKKRTEELNQELRKLRKEREELKTKELSSTENRRKRKKLYEEQKEIQKDLKTISGLNYLSYPKFLKKENEELEKMLNTPLSSDKEVRLSKKQSKIMSQTHSLMFNLNKETSDIRNSYEKMNYSLKELPPRSLAPEDFNHYIKFKNPSEAKKFIEFFNKLEEASWNR